MALTLERDAIEMSFIVQDEFTISEIVTDSIASSMRVEDSDFNMTISTDNPNIELNVDEG